MLPNISNHLVFKVELAQTSQANLTAQERLLMIEFPCASRTFSVIVIVIFIRSIKDISKVANIN